MIRIIYIQLNIVKQVILYKKIRATPKLEHMFWTRNTYSEEIGLQLISLVLRNVTVPETFYSPIFAFAHRALSERSACTQYAFTVHSFALSAPLPLIVPKAFTVRSQCVHYALSNRSGFVHRYFHITRKTVCKNEQIIFLDHIINKECKIWDKKKYKYITRKKTNEITNIRTSWCLRNLNIHRVRFNISTQVSILFFHKNFVFSINNQFQVLRNITISYIYISIKVFSNSKSNKTHTRVTE